MLYVQRNAQGQLIRVEAAAFAGAQETLAADAQEVQAWFANQDVESSLLQLKQSDLDMIRVLDDLVQVLMDMARTETAPRVARLATALEAAISCKEVGTRSSRRRSLAAKP